MSKKISLLLDEPCPELLCGLCSDVLEDPIQVHCPEDHMFCSKCIHSHVGHGQTTCPLCFTTLDKNSFQLSKFVQRQIGRLRIKCSYTDNGCLWQGLFSDNHILECEFKPTICPNSENGCTEINLNNSNLQQHMPTCLYQTISCPNNMPLCQTFLRKDLSIHENECQSYTCPYSIEGCPYIGTLTQVKIHCDGYCGRLHKKIQDLEEECKRLNSLISIGLNIKLPSTPETIEKHDTSMDEMALFHQMFNSDPFGNNTASSSVNTPMDLTSCLPDMGFLDSNSKIFDSTTTAESPQPLQFVTPVNVPKRTSNGKKIRYSKNVRLAHSAIRIARQRTASNNLLNPSNDAILNNLDIAKQQQQKITFKNLDDVTQFLNTDNNTLMTLPSTASIKKREQKKRNNSMTTAAAASPSLAKSPMEISVASSPPPTSPSSNNNTSVPLKRRPMFILASSYLSNYNSNNNSQEP